MCREETPGGTDQDSADSVISLVILETVGLETLGDCEGGQDLPVWTGAGVNISPDLLQQFTAGFLLEDPLDEITDQPAESSGKVGKFGLPESEERSGEVEEVSSLHQREDSGEAVSPGRGEKLQLLRLQVGREEELQ